MVMNTRTASIEVDLGVFEDEPLLPRWIAI
jgi:hypothetical protein